MKKLVTAFAACMIAGLVSAAVESANIVGYSSIALPQGFSFVTAPFIPVGGDGTVFKLGSIQPNENWDGAYSDTIQFVDATGETILMAWYIAGYGWHDFNDFEIVLDDYEIPAGVCAFVEATQEGALFTVSGEVAQAPLAMSVAQGFTLVGNSIPRDITLGEIVPNELWDGANNDTIQFIDATGEVILMAWYIAGYGWHDFNDFEIVLDDLVIPAGTGFFLEATQEGAQLVFPAAIPAA